MVEPMVLMLCELAKMGEYGVLPVYLLLLKIKSIDMNLIYLWNTEKYMCGYLLNSCLEILVTHFFVAFGVDEFENGEQAV